MENNSPPLPGKSPDKTAKPEPRLARATGVVAGITLGSRILGLGRDMIMAAFFGAGLAADAFVLAFTIPNLLRRLMAEGALSPAFVPIFADELRNSPEDARKALSAVSTFGLVLSIALTVLGIIFAPEITSFFAPGWADNPEKQQLAASLTRVMFPYLVFVTIISLANSALNTLGYFALPAAAPAILNIVLIASVAVFCNYSSEPIFIPAWAVLVGGAAGLFPLLTLLKKIGYGISLASPFSSPAVRKLLWLILPSVLSASVYQLMVLANRVLASLLGEGSVTWYYYADRVFQFPFGIYTLAIATAVLPALSKAAAAEDEKRYQFLLANTLCWITFITVPATIGLICLAEPITQAIFQRGQFSNNDGQQTARALVAFSVGLWPLSCHSILVRAFLAKKNTMMPAVISILSIALNIFFAICLMGPVIGNSQGQFSELIVHWQAAVGFSSLGHSGLALASSLASFFSFFTLLLLVPILGSQLALGGLIGTVGRAGLASLAMAAVIIGLSQVIADDLLLIMSAIPLGMVTFSICSALLGSHHNRQIYEKLWLLATKKR